MAHGMDALVAPRGGGRGPLLALLEDMISAANHSHLKGQAGVSGILVCYSYTKYGGYVYAGFVLP